MKFKELATYLEKLEQTSSRNEITSILAELLKTVPVEDIENVIYLMAGRLGPNYKNTEFQIAEKLVLVILAKAYGVELEIVKKAYKEKGDIGVVAEELSNNTNTTNIPNPTNGKDASISEIHQQLLEVAQVSGGGSVEKKVDGGVEILKSVDPLSARYIARIPTGNLRLGFSEKTVIDALSVMECGTKEKSKQILKAYEVVPDLGILAHDIKEKGIDKATKHITPKVGIPVMPMLCSRIKSPAEMIKKMGEVAVEPKFDGLRVLIHFSKSKKILRAFTRNLKDISNMFPELSQVGDYVEADEFILDSEAVGMDPELLTLADFQTTMHRRRKHGIEESQKAIPLSFQVFDILLADKESQMDTPYVERRELLKKLIRPNPLLKLDDYTITSDPELITKLHLELRSKGLEGIIVKRKDGGYIPGRTGWNWVKMKEAESAIGKLSDTIDGVIMGFTSGKGKRVGFGIGQFLVGVKEKDQFLTLTKVGTGLSDEQFRELSKRLTSLKILEKPKEYEVHRDLEPDFWVTPSVVVELAGDDLTISPKHTSGYALRFPRLVKFRDDKSAEGATTVKEVKKIFDMQKV
jgi:DNA ligase-1